MLLDEFLGVLDAHGRVKQSGGGYMAQCPSHDDGTESLSVKDGGDKILLKCQAGCATPAVVQAVGLEMHDLFYDSKASLSDDRIEDTYIYTDVEGQPVFEVVRFQGKRFRQRLPGAEDWGLQGLTNRPLYRLPNVARAIREGRRVYIVEGEKDVHALEAAGATATCAAGGAGKWSPTYVNFLRGVKQVRVIADRDEPGMMHAEQVAESLRQAGIEHVVMQAAEGKDAHDHLSAGLTTDDFVEVPKSYGGVSLISASMVEWKDIQWLVGWEGFFPIGGIAHLAGMPGVNKSTLTSRVAAEVSKRRGVMMITSEDSKESVIVPRLVAAGANLDRVHFPMKHLTLPHDQEAIEHFVQDLEIGLVVIDPVEAHLDGSVDSYKNQSIRSALAPLAFMADVMHVAVILVGHPTKGKERDPMLRVGGSIGIPGLARSAMIMGNHPDHPMEVGMRVLASYKGNWAQRPKSRAFTIRAANNGSIFLDSAGETYIPATMLFPKGAGKDGGAGNDV